MRSPKRVLPIAAVVGFFLIAGSTRGEWTPPKDNLFTEKQLTSYIEIMRDYVKDQKAASQALQGQSGLAAAGALARINEKHKAAIAAHGMSEAEFGWVATQVGQAYVAAFRQDTIDKMKADTLKQIKENQDRLAEQKKTLAIYQKAQKEGRRVMTADERKTAVDAATDERKAALDDARTHADEGKGFKDQIAKAQAEQKAAETALKNPPKFENDDERNSFNEEKKNAIQAAKDSVKDLMGQMAEASKAEAESRAKAAAADARIAQPDLPATADDKAEVKKQNDEKAQELAEQIKGVEDGDKLLQESAAKPNGIFGDDSSPPPAQNVTLFRKHQTEYKDAIGIAEKK